MKKFSIGPVCVVTPEGLFDDKQVWVEDGRIADITRFKGKADIDGEGLFLSAGFIDLHVHGGGGADFMDGTEEAFKTALRAHGQHGTTSIAPTTLTATLDEYKDMFEVYRKVKASDEPLPELLGIHMEGPYVAKSQAGAQDPAYIRNPADLSYQEIAGCADGAICIWTVAPELPGAAKMCEDLKSLGIVFSLGHTQATYAHAKEAVNAGYTMATHLFSSMSTITRENGFRVLGIIESSMLMDEICCEVIADGMHLPAELLQLIYKTKGKDRICLITDAMRGAGMPDGLYKLGSLKQGQEVIVGGGIARMPDGISFAGSVATTDRLVRVMTQQAGVPLQEAIQMITRNPARELGINDHKGELKPGYDADLVLFNDNIDVKKVFVKGTEIK